MVKAVSVLAAALLFPSSAWATPSPDPAPGSSKSVTWVDSEYDVPAVRADTGEVVPGIHFHCLVPARWHGRPNHDGRHRVCELRRDAIPRAPRRS